MRHLLLLASLLTLASCISFPRAEKARREGQVLNPEFNPWKRNPGTDAEIQHGQEGSAAAGNTPPMKARTDFKDPYFR
ncbi:hypothetical protein SAMN02745166_01812 [Prosthecobacter debontii]|uniref:Uncharacterized protein n=1 Tax=Prosthecobacter debontii TaxID=48467 RepID=A0A1T4XQX7_9BACT|nr:hypothetical protein [Prosthecobacter debontii]SKA91952.1 hypothetical protein SAMN02745166_01812 [Prosthecobacter debontii]